MIKKGLTLLFLMFFLVSCLKSTETKKVKELPKDKEGYVEFYQAIKSGKIKAEFEE